jgi:nucleoside 2-deoxyribosyltransferase
MKIYLAGPLFTKAERLFNGDLALKLQFRGHEVFLPQDQEVQHSGDPAAIFKADMTGLYWSEAIVANMDGTDPDSGTCWECGFAYAIGKPVVLFRTDIRGSVPHGPYNLMLHQSADAVVDCQFVNTRIIAARISEALHWRMVGSR